jgi:hypothetical protein
MPSLRLTSRPARLQFRDDAQTLGRSGLEGTTALQKSPEMPRTQVAPLVGIRPSPWQLLH